MMVAGKGGVAGISCVALAEESGADAAPLAFGVANGAARQRGNYTFKSSAGRLSASPCRAQIGMMTSPKKASTCSGARPI